MLGLFRVGLPGKYNGGAAGKGTQGLQGSIRRVDMKFDLGKLRSKDMTSMKQSG